MGPALAAAGVETRVQNFALGGTHSRPHPTWCAKAAWGGDVDAVFWDYDMTEAGGADRDAAAAFATALRGYDPAPLLTFKGGGVDDRPTAAAPLLEPHAAVLRYDPRKLLKGPLQEKRLDANGDCLAALQIPRDACYAKRFHPVGRCSSQVKWHPGWLVHQAHGSALAAAWLDALSAVLADPSSFSGPAPPKPTLPAIPATDSFLRTPLSEGLACATAYRPRAGLGVADLLEPERRDAVLAHRSQKVAAGVEPDGCGQGPSDQRGAVAVAPDMGPVRFVLKRVRRPLTLVLCEPATGWNRARGMIPLDGAGCAVSIDGAKATLKALPRNSHLQRCYAAAAVVTEGANEVTLEVRASGGAHLAARVSQVIWSSSEP